MSIVFPWSASITYGTGDQVSYFSYFYIASQSSLGYPPDTSPSFWTNIGPGGGGGGGGGVTSITGGAGITAVPTTGNVLISNTGVLDVSGGLGIQVTSNSGIYTVTNTVTPYTAGSGIDISMNVIRNTGVLDISAGAGISISDLNGVFTVTNLADAYTAGTGINIASGVISNTGVLQILGTNGSTDVSPLSGVGVVTVSASLSQPNKWVTGSILPNVAIAAGGFQTVGIINLPQSQGVGMLNQYSGIIVSALINVFGSLNTAINWRLVDYTNGTAPLYNAVYQWSFINGSSGSPTSYPVTLTFPARASTAGQGDGNYQPTQTELFIEANVAAGTITINGSNNNTWQALGIN